MGNICVCCSSRKSGGVNTPAARPRDNRLVRTDEKNPSGRLAAHFRYPDKNLLSSKKKKQKIDESIGTVIDVILFCELTIEQNKLMVITVFITTTTTITTTITTTTKTTTTTTATATTITETTTQQQQ